MKKPIAIPKGYEIVKLNGTASYTVLQWVAEDIVGYPAPVLRLRTLGSGHLSRYKAAQWLFKWIATGEPKKLIRKSKGAEVPAVLPSA